MQTVINLTLFKRYLGIEATQTQDDDRLITAMTGATTALEQRTHRHLNPVQRTQSVNLLTKAYVACLPDDLLTLISVTDATNQPVTVLEHNYAGLLVIEGQPALPLSVTGIWGYHQAWGHAWTAVDTLMASIDATTTLIDVGDVNAPDTLTGMPRFNVGDLIQIGSEYLRVVALDEANQRLEVLRGVNGSIASVHVLANPIMRYQADAYVIQVTLSWAAWLYRQPEWVVSAIPQSLMDMIAPLQRPRV